MPTTEARQAVADATRTSEVTQQGLKDELGRWPEVNRVTDAIRQAHLRNHLSESMEALILRANRQ